MTTDLHVRTNRSLHLRTVTFCLVLMGFVTATSLLLITTAWLLTTWLLGGLTRLPVVGWCVGMLLISGSAQAQSAGGLRLALYTKAGQQPAHRVDSVVAARPDTSLNYLLARSYHRRIIKPIPDWPNDDEPVQRLSSADNPEGMLLMIVATPDQPNRKEIRWLRKE